MGNWLKNKKVTGKKPIGGGKDPPVLMAVNILVGLTLKLEFSVYHS